MMFKKTTYLLLALFLISCEDHSEKRMKAKNSIFEEKAQASFEILKGDSLSGYDYKTKEVNYQLTFLKLKANQDLKHYVAKFITKSKTCTGCESAERSIDVELKDFDHPEKTLWKTSEKCDEFLLESTCFKTIKRGCCGDEDHISVFNYDKELICTGQTALTKLEIPNSSIECYFGFVSDVTENNSTLGTLSMAYDEQNTYSIQIKTHGKKSNYPLFSPEIKIHTNDGDDKFQAETTTYVLWSLDQIELRDQVDGIRLELIFENGDGDPIHVFIPLKKGAPFGKTAKQQVIYLD